MYYLNRTGSKLDVFIQLAANAGVNVFYDATAWEGKQYLMTNEQRLNEDIVFHRDLFCHVYWDDDGKYIPAIEGPAALDMAEKDFEAEIQTWQKKLNSVYALKEISDAIYVVSNAAKAYRDKQNEVWEKQGRCADLFAHKSRKDYLYELKDLALQKLLSTTAICPEAVDTQGENKLVRYNLGPHKVHYMYKGVDDPLFPGGLSSLPKGDDIEGNIPATRKMLDMSEEQAEEILLLYTLFYKCKGVNQINRVQVIA